MHRFRMRPSGAFDLRVARDFAGGFAPGMGASPDEPDAEALLVVFPVEGWASSAAVELRQESDGSIAGVVMGTDDVAGAQRQALRCLSLDHDGGGWLDVGQRDPVIGGLQQRYGPLRPVCFLSAWEAATSFVIGQRISMRQGARVKRGLAESVGDPIALPDGRTVHAFPRPDALLGVEASRASPRRRCDGSRASREPPWTVRSTPRRCVPCRRPRRSPGSRHSPASGPGPRLASSCAAVARPTRCRSAIASAARP